MERSNYSYISFRGEEVFTLMPMNSFKSAAEMKDYIAECEQDDDEYWQNYPNE